ncbi:hypothetical protein [Tenacibaculum xiamenense]|uniref:hypothetical protein n=1 Tax=Tenacibaculum xiamenense TaxID=1261553 RepID=UPI003895DBA9
MELTTHQIQRVENYLKHKGIYYEDIKIEILDHFLSDIEDQMYNNISFEDAFTNSKLKWLPHLTYSSSFHTGYAYSKPKFVIEKLKTFVKYNNYKIYGITLLLILGIKLNKFEIVVPHSSIVRAIVDGWILFTSAAIIISYIFILLKKVKTSYRFIFETQILGYLFFPLFMRGSNFLKNGNADLFDISIILYSIVIVHFAVKVFRKHLEFIKTDIA